MTPPVVCAPYEQVVAKESRLEFDPADLGDYSAEPDTEGHLITEVWTLVFDPAHPFTVTLTVHVAGEPPDEADAPMVMDRAMLAAALDRPVANDSVALVPDVDGLLQLTPNPLGNSYLPIYVPRSGVAEFLRAAAILVPPGSEADRIDWAAETARLLAPGDGSDGPDYRRNA